MAPKIGLSGSGSFLPRVTTAILAVLLSNMDRILAVYRRWNSFYKPEVDLRKGERFYVVTSSVKVEKPSNAPPESYEDVIGDLEPVVVATRKRSFEIAPYLPQGFPPDRFDDHIMAFGGEIGNDITTLLLKKLVCPLRFNGYSIVDRIDHTVFLPKLRDTDSRITTDYGLVVRAPNPRNSSKTVYVFAAIHKQGTLGAALCTQPEYSHILSSRVKGKKGICCPCGS